ncbi:MAG: amidohydrolase [Candidatus Omnitrophica bacterium]|nr:amidohydrolase [Candidatus Omnitrophota bacterium]
MINDAHIHFIPKELSVHTSFYKGVWADKNKLFSYLDQNKIDKALLTYPSTDAGSKIGEREVCRIYNQALKGMIKDNSKIIAAGLIDVQDSSIGDQAQILKEEGFNAINISSSYQGKFLVEKLIPLFKRAEKLQMPIFVHPQTINPIGFARVKDPLLMPVLEYSFESSMFMGLLMTEGILKKFETKFIFSSLGGVVPFLKDRFDRVYKMLRSRNIVKDLGDDPSQILRGVYVDTSGSSLANIKIALELFGSDHILWGSDYPVNPPIEDNLKMLDDLDDLKQKIVYKNFKKLFKL